MFFRVACPVNLRGVFVVGKRSWTSTGVRGGGLPLHRQAFGPCSTSVNVPRLQYLVEESNSKNYELLSY